MSYIIPQIKTGSDHLKRSKLQISHPLDSNEVVDSTTLDHFFRTYQKHDIAQLRAFLEIPCLSIVNIKDLRRSHIITYRMFCEAISPIFTVWKTTSPIRQKFDFIVTDYRNTTTPSFDQITWLALTILNLKSKDFSDDCPIELMLRECFITRRQPTLISTIAQSLGDHDFLTQAKQIRIIQLQKELECKVTNKGYEMALSLQKEYFDKADHRFAMYVKFRLLHASRVSIDISACSDDLRIETLKLYSLQQYIRNYD